VEFENELYVIEVNPRSSRTIPFISKVTGIPMVKLGTEVALGSTLEQLGYEGGLHPSPDFFAVKVPVFSFNKLEQVDITLGPEMKSTGEVMGIDRSLKTALYKGLIAAGMEIPQKGTIVATIADKDKAEALPILKGFAEMGFKLVATEGTAQALREIGIEVETVKKIKDGSPNIIDMLRLGEVDFIVNTLTHGRLQFSDGFQIRRVAVELNVPCLTSLDTLHAMQQVIGEGKNIQDMQCNSLQEYVNGTFI
jgi:carbamoyl-phosphate synthase large subunit